MIVDRIQPVFDIADRTAGGSDRVKSTGLRLGVAPFLLGDPITREVVGTYNKFEDAEKSLHNLSQRLLLPQEPGTFIPPAILTSDGPAWTYEQGDAVTLSPLLISLLNSNSHRAECLMRFGQALAVDGLHLGAPSKDRVFQDLGIFLEEYGFFVADMNVPSENLTEHASQRSFSEKYYRKLQIHFADYRRIREAEMGVLQRQVPDMKYVLVARYSNAFVPEGPVVYAPRFHEYTTALNELHAMRCCEGEEFQDNILRERISDLLLLTREIMMDGLNGTVVDPHQVHTRMNFILHPYDLYVDAKPLSQRKLFADKWHEARSKKRRVIESAQTDSEWSTIARNYAEESQLHNYGIAETYWNTDQVRDVVSVILDAQGLQRDLSVLHVTRMPFVSGIVGEGEDRGFLTEGTYGINARASRAELVMRVVMSILEEGFEGETHSNYIRDKINNALLLYGLTATLAEREAGQVVERRGMWAQVSSDGEPLKLYRKYKERYGEETKGRWYYPQESISPERAMLIDQVGQQRSLSLDELDYSIVRQFVDCTMRLESLRNFILNSHSVHTTGITPSIAVRFGSAATLLKIAQMFMEEGVFASFIDREELRQNVNIALASYGVTIKENDNSRL